MKKTPSLPKDLSEIAASTRTPAKERVGTRLPRSKESTPVEDKQEKSKPIEPSKLPASKEPSKISPPKELSKTSLIPKEPSKPVPKKPDVEPPSEPLSKVILF